MIKLLCVMAVCVAAVCDALRDSYVFISALKRRPQWLQARLWKFWHLIKFISLVAYMALGAALCAIWFTSGAVSALLMLFASALLDLVVFEVVYAWGPPRATFIYFPWAAGGHQAVVHFSSKRARVLMVLAVVTAGWLIYLA